MNSYRKLNKAKKLQPQLSETVQVTGAMSQLGEEWVCVDDGLRSAWVGQEPVYCFVVDR